jgi:ribose transport system substrate-binding protein
MNRRKALAVALAAGVAWLSPHGLAAGRPTFAVVLKATRNPFFVLMAEGARKHAAQHADDYDFVLEGVEGETDVKGQEAIVRKLIARHIDALLIVPADSAAMLPVVLKAMEAGILVINIDNKFDDRELATAGVNVPFVGPSNFAGARSVGDYVARQMAKGSRVGLIEGPPGSINAKARSDGFREAMRSAGMQVAGIRSGYWDVERGRAAALELLKAVPDLRALLCGNDNMAIGAVQAVDQSGLKGKVMVAGYDNIPAMHALIAEGSIVATADQYPAKQAEYALDLALKALRAGTRQADMPTIVQTPVLLVNR